MKFIYLSLSLLAFTLVTYHYQYSPTTNQRKIAQSIEHNNNEAAHLLEQQASELLQASDDESKNAAAILLEMAGSARNQKINKNRSGWKKLGRSLIKVSGFISLQTTKPFLAIGSFFSGFFHKKDKHNELYAVREFLQKHKREYKSAWKEVEQTEELIYILADITYKITGQKFVRILNDLLHEKGHDGQIKFIINENETDPTRKYELDLDEVDVFAIAADLENLLDANFINNHQEYQDFKPLIGELDNELLYSLLTEDAQTIFSDLIDVVSSQLLTELFRLPFGKEKKEYSDKDMIIAGSLKGSSLMLSRHILGPKTLALITKSLGSIFSVSLIASDIATVAATVHCRKQKTIDRFQEDPRLLKKCQYITNKAALDLVFVNNSSTLAGRKTRDWFRKIFSKK